MTCIDILWKVHCLLYYRPAIDKARESAAVKMHSGVLADYLNALCNKGRREHRKSYLQRVRGSRNASESQANV
jgi:hypothetical protein